jgi:hypothetical protein
MASGTLTERGAIESAGIVAVPGAVGGAGAGARSGLVAAIVEWGLITSSYLTLFFADHWIGADGAMRYDALSTYLETGKMPHVKLSLVGPFFSTPLYYLGKRLWKDPRAACAYYNWVLLGVCLVVLARLLRSQLPAQTARRFLLVLVAASMFAFHAGPYYGEVFTAVCVGTGILSVCTRRTSVLGWTAIVLGTVNTPASGVGAVAVCGLFGLQRRQFRYVVPIVAIAALGVAEAYWHRGGLTSSGYEGDHGNKTVMPYSGLPNFSYPMFLGILGGLLSFGKGILFYEPGLLAPVRRHLRGWPGVARAHTLWMVFLAGLLLVYSKWWAWQGGEFWGPRYLFFAVIPASLALACNLGKPQSIPWGMAVLAMLTLSVWIAAEGVMFGQQHLEECNMNSYALEHLCWYVPEFTAWIRPFIIRRDLRPKDWLFISDYVAVYLYLAVPVAVSLVRTTTPLVWTHVKRALQLSAWRV